VVLYWPAGKERQEWPFSRGDTWSVGEGPGAALGGGSWPEGAGGALHGDVGRGGERKEGDEHVGRYGLAGVGRPEMNS
jgi:hypothetical protein